MSIESQINRIQGAKEDLKTVIENKGVTVPSATTLDGYAALVGQIETDLSDYYTSGETEEAIAQAIADETARTETTYLKEHQSLADYYTSAETESAITSAITEVTQIVYDNERIVAESFMAETARTEQTYLKPSSLNPYATKQYVNDAISGISTSAETQQLINTAMATETARTETTYLKPQALSTYYTSGETDTKIDSALTNYMTISQLNEIFSVLEKKPAVIYEHDANNPIHGQTGNLFTATVWHTLANADLSNYCRLRVYVNPSSQNVGLSTNNHTSAAIFEISLNNSSLTTNVPYYSGGVVTSCLNNDNRLYSVAAMVRNENNAWQIALKTVSLYGTSSSDITDSYIYKIEGIYDSSYNLVNPVTTYSGSGLPNPQDGNNGDLYLQTE